MNGVPSNFSDAYDDESIMGLQSSTGFSQAFEETVSIDDSNLGVETVNDGVSPTVFK